jgi:hypothetical protein
LDEDGGEFVVQEARVVAELGEDLAAAFAEAKLVRDLLWELEGEGEARRRALVPAVHGGGGGDGVEGGVNFDGVVSVRVELEHRGRARAARVENLLVRGRAGHPILVVPTLAADVRAGGA